LANAERIRLVEETMHPGMSVSARELGLAAAKLPVPVKPGAHHER
jgi:hypothetical protein